MQVTVTVCREGALQEVALRLGVESALGTTSMVHFCGAQFQVCIQFSFPACKQLRALLLEVAGTLATSERRYRQFSKSVAT